MLDNDFIWLQNQYRKKEKIISVYIGTIDNPGWSISILLNSLENQIEFLKMKSERSEDDWFHCFLDENRFEGRCGPLNLSEVLREFRRWIEPIHTQNEKSSFSDLGSLNWLQQWYFKNCDGDWEHEYGVEILAENNSEWNIKIDLDETEHVENPFNPIESIKSESDWYRCSIIEKKFLAHCGPCNVLDVLDVFRKWCQE